MKKQKLNHFRRHVNNDEAKWPTYSSATIGGHFVFPPNQNFQKKSIFQCNFIYFLDILSSYNLGSYFTYLHIRGDGMVEGPETGFARSKVKVRFQKHSSHWH